MWVWMMMAVGCGPAADAPTTAVAPVAPTELRELTVGTWNVEWLDSQVGAGRQPRNERDYAELARIVASADADVWAFQEVADAAAVERIVPDGWTVRVEERRAEQRVAFAIRPGLPARFSENTDIGLGRSGLRNGLVASVAGVDMMTIHLKAGCQWDPFERSDDCRTVGEQLERVDHWLDAAAGPAMVIGDYNRQLSADDESWAVLNDGDPGPVTAPLLGARNQCHGSRARHPIDHAVVRGLPASAVQAEQLSDAASSDHCPVVVTLTLPSD